MLGAQGNCLEKGCRSAVKVATPSSPAEDIRSSFSHEGDLSHNNWESWPSTPATEQRPKVENFGLQESRIILASMIKFWVSFLSKNGLLPPFAAPTQQPKLHRSTQGKEEKKYYEKCTC